jgi:hypothetical protein
MNERLKELAEQAELVWSERNGWWIAYDDSKDLERFAELIRQDERDKCAQDYLQDCCDAIDAARLEEREAIAALVEADGRVHPKAPDAVWAKTVAKLIRARGEQALDKKADNARDLGMNYEPDAVQPKD